MLQQSKPDDYVIATGETHSVREFLDEAFGYAKLDWKKYVEVDKRYFRPTEVDCLVGDSTKARHILGWKPKVNFRSLVHKWLILTWNWFAVSSKVLRALLPENEFLER